VLTGIINGACDFRRSIRGDGAAISGRRQRPRGTVLLFLLKCCLSMRQLAVTSNEQCLTHSLANRSISRLCAWRRDARVMPSRLSTAIIVGLMASCGDVASKSVGEENWHRFLTLCIALAKASVALLIRGRAKLEELGIR